METPNTTLIAKYRFHLTESLHLRTDGTATEINLDCGDGIRIRFAVPPLAEGAGDAFLQKMRGLDRRFVGRQGGFALWELDYVPVDVQIEVEPGRSAGVFFAENNERLLTRTLHEAMSVANRFLRWARFASSQASLPDLILVLSEQVQKAQLKLAWLDTIRWSGLEFGLLAGHLANDTKEPITESGWKEREQELRDDLLPVGDCVYLAIDHRDYKTDTAYGRAQDDMEKAILSAVKDGTLAAKGKGRRAEIRSGVFHDWLGKPMPVFPDWGYEYEVQPDAEANEVERRRTSRLRVQELLQRVPRFLDLPFDLDEALKQPPEPTVLAHNGLGIGLAIGIKGALLSLSEQLRSIEVVVNEMQERLDGEDVLVYLVRDSFDYALRTLAAVHERVQEYTGPFELPGAGASLDDTRALAKLAAE